MKTPFENINVWLLPKTITSYELASLASKPHKEIIQDISYAYNRMIARGEDPCIEARALHLTIDTAIVIEIANMYREKKQSYRSPDDAKPLKQSDYLSEIQHSCGYACYG